MFKKIMVIIGIFVATQANAGEQLKTENLTDDTRIYHSRSEVGYKCKWIYSLPGVEECHDYSKYAMWLRKGKMYDWSELDGAVQFVILEGDPNYHPFYHDDHVYDPRLMSP